MTRDCGMCNYHSIMDESTVSDMINDAINDLRAEFDEKIKVLQAAIEELKKK